MKFSYNINNSIPAGAWCAGIERGNDIISVEIGSAVEYTTDFFVQGVWDGEYSDGNFFNAHFACCSGGSVKNCKLGGAFFSTPNHLLETIYGIRCNNKIYLSNSLAFVLERSNSALDIDYPNYQLDMCSSIFGIENQIRVSPLKDGRFVNYYRCCNIEINSELNISVNTKFSGLSFSDYTDYYTKISQVLKDLYKNAESNSRRIKFESISTISRGYDAVATSVLAYQQGCKKVITFNTPKQYAEDCGKDIAKRIGFEDIFLCNADLYRNQNDYIEADCMSSGDVGSSIIFAAHKELFKNSMVMMGIRGDSLWERNHSNVNNSQNFTVGNTLQQTDHTFIETCLEVNAICIPLPMIGADKWTDIANISNSNELKPYSVRDLYDRPIPRRIAEEYGIPRDWFGLEKAGAGISYHFDTFNRVLGKMSKTSAKSLIQFRKEFKRSKYSLLRQHLIFYYNELPVYINYLSSKLHLPLKLSNKTTYVSSPLSSLLIHWSIKTVRAKYNKI